MPSSNAGSDSINSSMSFDRFKGLMSAAMAVPKTEIDALEKQEKESKTPRKKRESVKKAA